MRHAMLCILLFPIAALADATDVSENDPDGASTLAAPPQEPKPTPNPNPNPIPNPIPNPSPIPIPSPSPIPIPIPNPIPGTTPVPRAVRVARGPSVDGRLDDAAWAGAPVFDGFILNEPTEGGPGSERTELRVVFDEENLYFAFDNHDSRPREIVRSLARRDSEPASDFVLVAIAPSNDGKSARRFYLNAGGVQADSLHYDDTQGSQTWDAVWRGAVARGDGGWTAEIAIPLYLVGSFDGPRPSWGFLARRYIARTHERVSSVLIPRADNAFVSRFGALTGTETLAPRRALELLPYVAFRSLFRPVGPEPAASREGLAAGDIGVDAAVILGHSLTLNAAINPDFGQVEADDIVLNVSTFETFFPEKRPFFTQGLDLFEPVGGDTTLQSLFYSRRIGRGAPILGAAKLAGTPLPGFSFGLLDAVVTPRRPLHLESIAESPSSQTTTNYLAAVTRAAIGGGSWAGARFSSATPLGGECTAADLTATPPPDRCVTLGGNALAVDTNLRSPGGDWAIYGQLAASQVVGGPPTRRLLDGTDLDRGDLGVGGFVRAGKFGGEPWRLEAGYDHESPTFDLNATGFQLNQNRHRVHLNGGWFRPSGLGPLHSFDVTLQSALAFSSDGRGLPTERNVALYTNAVLPGFHTLRWNLFTAYGETDLRELRGSGVAIAYPSIEYTRLTFESDPSRVVSGIALVALGHHDAAGPTRGRFDWTLTGGMVVRPSDAWETRLDVTADRTLFSPRYVDRLADDRFLLGSLDYLLLKATLRQQWAVTRDFTLQAYVQWFSAFGVYGPFFEAGGTPSDTIRQDELVAAAAPMTSPNFHTAQLAVNLIARWEYRPGSTIYLVYQRNQSELAPDVVEKNLGSSTLFDGPAVDVISLKWTWFWSGS